MITFHPSRWKDLFNCKYWLLKKGLFFFKQISDRLDFFPCSLSVVTTSPGTLSTWSRSTPAPASTTSTTWTSSGTTPPPSPGGTSCWRPTTSTTSTWRNWETRRSSKPLWISVFTPVLSGRRNRNPQREHKHCCFFSRSTYWNRHTHNLKVYFKWIWTKKTFFQNLLCKKK